jgi:hypothetical protein
MTKERGLNGRFLKGHRRVPGTGPSLSKFLDDFEKSGEVYRRNDRPVQDVSSRVVFQRYNGCTRVVCGPAT